MSAEVPPPGNDRVLFLVGKEHADGSRTWVWSTDVLRGMMFVQFVSLCYYEYLNEALRHIKGHTGKGERRPWA